MAISDLILWCDGSTDDSGESSALRPGDRPRSATSAQTRTAAVDPAQERELLEDMRAGSEAAFEKVYLALYRPLREFAYALTHDDGVAHDIVQDVLFVFWRDRARVQPGDRFVPYLYKAIRNQSAKHWRHARVVRQLAHTSGVQREHPDAVPGMGETPSGTLEQTEQFELHVALVDAIERLPDRQRAIVTLHLTGELAAAEIGDVLGISPEAVLMALSRARRTLRTVLEKFRR